MEAYKYTCPRTDKCPLSKKCFVIKLPQKLVVPLPVWQKCKAEGCDILIHIGEKPS